MSTPQVAKFLATLPPAETELHICPPDCRECHDIKWYGVTVPIPKVKKEVKVRQPELFRFTPPKPKVVWEDPYPSLDSKEWREAMKRDGKSCWKHFEPPIEGAIQEMVPPTTSQLQTHARKFGLKSPATLVSVQESADMYGVDVKIPKSALVPKKSPRMPSRKERAQQLLDMGYTWDIIEDELNLSRPQSIELKEELLGVGA